MPPPPAPDNAAPPIDSTQAFRSADLQRETNLPATTLGYPRLTAVYVRVHALGVATGRVAAVASVVVAF